MTDDIARTNPVFSQGSILWAKDDALARAVGIAEYSSRVRGTGFVPLPVRPTSRSPTSSASRLSQEAAFNNRMNEMMKEWEEDRRKAEEDRRREDEERRRADEEIAV
jgi:hypothetical protein